MPEESYTIDEIYSELRSRGVKNDDPRIPKLLKVLGDGGLLKSSSGAGVQSGLTSAYAPGRKQTPQQRAQSLVDKVGFVPGATTPQDSTMSGRLPATSGDPNVGFSDRGKGLLARGRVDAKKISDPEIFASMIGGNVIPTLSGLTGGLFGTAGGGFLGGLAGGVAGGMGGAKAQNEFMKMGGWSDKDLEELGKRTEQFRKEHPYLAFTAEALPNLITGKPVGPGVLKAIASKAGAKAIGKELVKEIPARIGGAAMMGGIGSAQRKLQGAPVDASTIASDMAMGFVTHGANQNWVDRNFPVESGGVRIPSLRKSKPAPKGVSLETLFSNPETSGMMDDALGELHAPGLDDATAQRRVQTLNKISGQNLSLEDWMGIGLNRGVESMVQTQTSEPQMPRPVPPLAMDEGGQIPLFDPLAPGMQGEAPLNVVRQLNLIDDNTIGPKPTIDPSLPADPEIVARQSRLPQNEASNTRVSSSIAENDALVSRLTQQLNAATTAKAKARITRQIHDALESGRLLRQQLKFENLSGRPTEESVVADLLARRRARESEQATPVRQEPVVPLPPVRMPEPAPDLSPGRSPVVEDAPPPFDPAQAAIDNQTARAKATAQAYDLYKGAYGTNRKGLEAERIRQTKIMTGNGSEQAKSNAAINRAALDRLIDETPEAEPTQPKTPRATKAQTSEPVATPQADDLAPGQKTTEPTPKKTRAPKAAPAPKAEVVPSEDMTPADVAKATARPKATPGLEPGQVEAPRTPVAPTRTAPAEGEVAPGRLASAAKAETKTSDAQQGHLPGQAKPKTELPDWQAKGVRKRLTKAEREAEAAAAKAKADAELERNLASYKEREAARKKRAEAESEEYVAKQLAKLPDSVLVNPEKFKSDAPGQTDTSKKKVDDGPARPGDTVRFPVGKNDKGETVYREGTLSSGGTEKSVVLASKDASGVARKVEVPSDQVEVVARKQRQTSEADDISSPSRGDGSHYIERDAETGQHFLHRTKDDKTPIPTSTAKKIASILNRFPTKNPRDTHDLSTGMARSMSGTPLDPSIDNSGKVVKVWNGSEMTLAVIRRAAAGRPSSSPRNVNLHQPAWLESVWKAQKGEDSFLPDTPDWLPHDEVSPYGATEATLGRAFDRTRTRLGIESPTPDSSKPIQTDKGIAGVQAPTLKMQVFRETKMGTPTRDLADHLDIPVVDPKMNRSGDDTARLFPGSKVELVAWATTKTAFKNPRMNKQAIDTIKGQVIDISKSEGSNTGFAIVRVSETAKLNDGAVIPAGTKISVYIGDSVPEGHTGFTTDNIRRIETMDSKGKRGMMLVDDKPIGSKVTKGIWVDKEAAFHKADTLEAQTSESKKFIEETLKRNKKEREDSC